MGCFKKVAAEIGDVYRDLTVDTVAPATTGGSAFLDLENTEEPHGGSIKFTVMPPLKRFSDIGRLSGGERALAAMALIFAISKVQGSPFLVLEVDASLDSTNLQALASFLQRSAFQTIVISLKDKFFSHSDALVGVTKNKRMETSVILTMDLKPFRKTRLTDTLPPVLADYTCRDPHHGPHSTTME